MRKTIVLFILLLGLVSELYAHKLHQADTTTYPKYEVRLGWAGAPLVDYSNSGVWANRWMEPYFDNSLGGLYQDIKGSTIITGVISADVDIYFKKWLSLNVSLNFNNISKYAFDGYSFDKFLKSSHTYITILPAVKFTYLTRPIVRLYSSVGLGLTCVAGKDDSMDMRAYPNIQVVPFGISLGKKVYGFAEFGTGMLYMGGRVGIGYKF